MTFADLVSACRKAYRAGSRLTPSTPRATVAPVFDLAESYPVYGSVGDDLLHLVKVSLACVERARVLKPKHAWLLLVESPAQCSVATSNPLWWVELDRAIAQAAR